MSGSFVVDDSDSQYFQGYLRGLATEIETREFIGPAMKYAYKQLKNRFELAADFAAARNKDAWYHVYEWGDDWESRKNNAGVSTHRLWKLTNIGSGANLGVGFVFLPSVKPTPLHPEEIKVGVERRHTFTWKAPVMEYGETVTISPVEALHGRLVFFWESPRGPNKIVSTAKSVTTTLDPNVIGTFTGFFLAWWKTEAPAIFEKEIRPIFERDIVKDVVVPRGPGGRFAPGRSKKASRALMSGAIGQRHSISMDRASEEEGYKDAIRAMERIAAGYAQGAGGEENYRG